MHADVQKYFDTLEANEKLRTEARRKRNEARAAAEDEYMAVLDKVNSDIAVEELQQSSDPLVAWIAKIPMRNYPDYARDVLKLLPATREELDAHAATNGWCGDWDRYMDRAEAAGVLPPAQNRTTEASQKLHQYVTSTWGGETARALRLLVAAAVAAELEAAKAAAEQKAPAVAAPEAAE